MLSRSGSVFRLDLLNMIHQPPGQPHGVIPASTTRVTPKADAPMFARSVLDVSGLIGDGVLRQISTGAEMGCRNVLGSKCVGSKVSPHPLTTDYTKIIA